MFRMIGRSTATAIALAAVSTAAVAQTPAPAAPPAPDYTLTANVGLFSEYIFRGISQTAGKPAIQGGFDFAHSSGFYLGTWASNVSWLEDFGLYSRSSMEWDFYGGFKAPIGSSDFTWDLGVLYYHYPGSRFSGVTNADTTEIYIGLGWQWLSGKISYTAGDNYFGTQPTGARTRGTLYYEANAGYPIGDTGVTLLGHFGYLDVKRDGSGDGKAGYSDWRVGASWVVPDGFAKGVELGAYYSGNNAKKAFYTDLTGYDTSKDRGVVYVKKTF